MSLVLNSSSSYIQSKFDPRSVGICILWLDASDKSTISPSNITANTTVTGWKDKSGCGNHVGTVVNTPFYTSFVSNSNYPAISFTNSGSGFRGAFTGNTNVTTGQVSVFAVAELENGGVANGRIVSLTTTTTNDTASVSACAALRRSGSGSAIHAFRNGVSLSSVSISYSQIYAFSSVFDGGNQRTYANGTQGSQRASGSNFASTNYGIGIEGRSIADNFFGRISEVLIYNGFLSTEERQLIEGYLSSKWPLFNRLSNTATVLHPYYYAPKMFTRYFNPVDLRDCIVWIDASDKASMDFSGSNITALRNKSDLTTSITTYDTPTWSNTGLNNLPAIDLSSGRFIGEFSTLSGNSLLRYRYTAFIVGSRTSTPASGSSMVALSQSATGSSVFLRILDFASSNFRTAAFFSAVTTSTWTASNNGISFIWRSSYASTGNNSAFTTTLNGGSPSTGTIGTQPTSSPSHFMIGCDGFTGATTTNSWPGKICEFILYNRLLSNQEVRIIEGYLSWKWDRQLTDDRHSFYRPINKPLAYNINPSFISSTLTLWLDAADTSGSISKTGTTLSTWRNKGGYGTNNNYTPTAGNVGTITHGVTSMNGLPTVYIPGSSSLSNTSFTTSAQSFSYFFILRVSDLGGSTSFRPFDNVSGGWQPYFILGSLDTTPWTITLSSTNSTPLVASVNSSFQLNTIYLISMVLSTVNANNRVAVNGTTQTLTTSSNSILTFNTPIKYYISSATPTNVAWDIGEFLVYSSALTDGNRKQVEGYLAWKWGVQGNLPTTHMFSKIRL